MESDRKLKSIEIPDGLSLIKGGEPFFFEGKGDTGCLLMQGFTSTPASVRPMGKYLASKGLTVLCPRLPGHSTTPEDMAKYSLEDWTAAAEAAFLELKSICDRVYVSGLSMGGTLTLHLGEVFPGQLAGLIPISTPVYAKNPVIKLLPVMKPFIKYWKGISGDLKDPEASEIAYNRFPLRSFNELMKLMRTAKENLDKITDPIRIFQAKDDHVVSPDNGPYILEHVGSKDKDLIWLDNSYHVATLDLQKDYIAEKSYEFISR